MNAQLEEMSVAMETAVFKLMVAERELKVIQGTVEGLGVIFDKLKTDLKVVGGDDVKQQSLSQPISSQIPPNKYRALAQCISNELMETKHMSVYGDFVGAINVMERLVTRLEKDGSLSVHDSMIPQD